MLSNSCPLLEVCDLSGGVIESESALSAFFRNCRNLIEFSAYDWPFQAILPFAENLQSLVVRRNLSVRKSGSGRRTLEITSRISEEVLCAVLHQNPQLQSVSLTICFDNLTSVIEDIVQSCPLLTSLQVTNTLVGKSRRKAASLLSLGRLMHITSLHVCSLEGFTMKVLPTVLENKSSSLLSLTLAECSIASDMLAIIGKLCPALTSLDLSGNDRIKSVDVVNLLNSCINLEVLCLKHCSRITSEILLKIKSPPMKSLNVSHTKIGKTDLASFDAVEGFKYEV